MAHVLVVGGGLSGCAAALEMARKNQKVTIIEKTAGIGGKVRQFGCKSSKGECTNCGLCLVEDLWESVLNDSSIEIVTESKLLDVTGEKGNFTVTYKGSKGVKNISGVSSIVVSIGFENSTSKSYGNLEFADSKNIISGFELEKLISRRSKTGIFQESPSKVAFIQCMGSRDVQEKALYCSRVCCGYSTRAARVLKEYYPDSQITFFYMDLQYVKGGQYLQELTGEGMEFIKCRPVVIGKGNPPHITFEDPKTGIVTQREFDLIVVSEGISPPADAEAVSELCALGVDEKGFLKHVREGAKTGIYVCGCASGPKRIEEAYNESLAVARQVLEDIV